MSADPIDWTVIALWSIGAIAFLAVVGVLFAGDWHVTNQTLASLVECARTGMSATDCRVLIYGAK